MTDQLSTAPTVAVIGDNPTRLWGISMTERTRRIARAAKLGWAEPGVDGAAPAAPVVLVNPAFAFDPGWLRHVAAHPGLALTKGGVPVLAHATSDATAAAVAGAMQDGTVLDAPGLETVAYESGPTLENEELRKREVPFLDRLEPATVRSLERASYAGAYKGVTDLLTKYLWPEWALVLTRLAARIGMTPNMVTSVGAILCVIATICFFRGWYWTGLGLGLVFMVLDTVDGKLARCTITSSWWGNIFDHGIDLIHPPIWWYAWGVGLGAVGLALTDTMFWTVMAVMLAGYVLQRLIEGAFIQQFGMHIHVWRKFDSDFRLVTARRNPNMVILFASLLFGRPDVGLIAVAVWTMLSLVVHLVQLVQAFIARARGQKLVSWLATDASAST
ncbi:CDP-alcohol phosphatidyltransferase family protein [Sphingosinicella sp. LHD-64]|uniref:CDP-alcohol phosphatidyltransferase family protein n=1 Tax=Sphingosinicella sp. LHD-64 TaxID=3072139 RepID=UPI00281084B0|nr:CDP-alcohol phosphatidyltransferase family protein [Sphingosinicella sp. LHD-64]MDQ8756376.1 CDP-alcohol phosphatidyltransferase family protein [Sphingosinicella sp. LHD-64]